MYEHRAMLRGILRALKPGGRLVLIEPAPRPVETTRETQMKAHRLAIDFAEQDLRDAGFDVTRRDDRFDTRMGDERDVVDWLIVARRPI
ncbi:MAG: hypothetical protein HYS05_00540 [Acidobacteria bacterium]|nr:hypothetical protein [Acidobacteriota bacterium]